MDGWVGGLSSLLNNHQCEVTPEETCRSHQGHGVSTERAKQRQHKRVQKQGQAEAKLGPNTEFYFHVIPLQQSGLLTSCSLR